MIVVPTAAWLHTPFDALAWVSASATGLLVSRWRLRDAGLRLARTARPGYFVALAIGAVGGAWAAGSLNTLRSAVPTLSHSIAGALAGAIVAVELYKVPAGIRGSTGTSFVAPLAAGIAVGRWGCLFSGLADRTYGTPTMLPWAVDLGDGIGRHPVEIYESLAMLAFLALFLLALRARASWALSRGFYVFAAWYGLQRFAWEFLKPYPRLIGPLNLFHIICGGLVLYGVMFFLADRARERRLAPGGAVPVLRRDDEPVRDLP